MTGSCRRSRALELTTASSSCWLQFVDIHGAAKAKMVPVGCLDEGSTWGPVSPGAPVGGRVRAHIARHAGPHRPGAPIRRLPWHAEHGAVCREPVRRRPAASLLLPDESLPRAGRGPVEGICIQCGHGARVFPGHTRGRTDRSPLGSAGRRPAGQSRATTSARWLRRWPFCRS